MPSNRGHSLLRGSSVVKVSPKNISPNSIVIYTVVLFALSIFFFFFIFHSRDILENERKPLFQEVSEIQKIYTNRPTIPSTEPVAKTPRILRSRKEPKLSLGRGFKIEDTLPLIEGLLNLGIVAALLESSRLLGSSAIVTWVQGVSKMVLLEIHQIRYCRKIVRNVAAMATGEAHAEVATTELLEILKTVQEAWDKIEDKYAVSSLAIAGAVALYGSIGMISAIDRLPLLPGVLELVGIGYTGVGSRFGESMMKLGSMLTDGQVGRFKDKSAASMFGDILPVQAVDTSTGQ